MSSQYFSFHKDGHSIDLNLNLSGYATKDDLKNLNADTSSFALKNNLTGLKTKLDNIESDSVISEVGIKRLIALTFVNSINLSIAALRSMTNAEINEYVKNTVLKKVADI